MAESAQQSAENSPESQDSPPISDVFVIPVADEELCAYLTEEELGIVADEIPARIADLLTTPPGSAHAIFSAALPVFHALVKNSGEFDWRANLNGLRLAVRLLQSLLPDLTKIVGALRSIFKLAPILR